MRHPRPRPRPRPRLIATDLDGTLLRRDGTVSERTLRALRTAVEGGADIVFVTARPPRYVDALAAATGLAGTAVCSNGAQVYDVGARTVVRSRALVPATARRVATVLAEAAPGLGFAVETGLKVLYEPTYLLRFSGGLAAESPVASLGDLWLLDVPIVKLLAHSHRFDADVLVALAEEAVGGEAQFTHSGGRGLLEISARGVTKAAALSALCAERGITAREVVAFGDMPNDLAILRWAGSGYAMGNAHPSVLAAIPGRTASNEEDGVARVLERLFDEARPR
ncbi:HAD hydrolase family protein [Streptomyces tirandamycinicus]|uniref:HAD hydrolase family protein n=1 Tax=Streptomyces tirandamycinicus TaxID=2174846 RepID=UPI00226DF889|nr:HAD hydrolase family protein [Streptomyces tirandamycinicus]MCY0980966.1 HAD hydrolase family protein [Streptomyces tirandamycinicus]